jgi:hypothetical protein
MELEHAIGQVRQLYRTVTGHEIPRDGTGGVPRIDVP